VRTAKHNATKQNSSTKIKKRKKKKRNTRKVKQPAFITTIHNDISQKRTHVASTLFCRCDVTVSVT